MDEPLYHYTCRKVEFRSKAYLFFNLQHLTRWFISDHLSGMLLFGVQLCVTRLFRVFSPFFFLFFLFLITFRVFSGVKRKY